MRFLTHPLVFYTNLLVAESGKITEGLKFLASSKSIKAYE